MIKIEPTAKQLKNCAEWNLDMAERLKTSDKPTASRMLSQAKRLFKQAEQLDSVEPPGEV
jgi:hypothetical protein